MLKTLRKWLGFHVHTWSDWESQGELKMGQKIVGFWQTRRCTECKKLEIKKVY